jgi:SAM-dependent methyltransferase
MNTLYIDSTSLKTELCEIGAKYNTDKSPFSPNSVCCGHRKGYTAFYAALLAKYKSISFNLAEIGIEQSASLLTWSEYFPLADISMFDLMESKLKKGESYNLPNTNFHKIDVSSENSINESFKLSGKIFDVVIDDSSHDILHQNNIIKNVHKFIKKGGILIIEDLERQTPFEVFNIDHDIWCFSTFVICDHSNRHCTDNDKILYLVKK